MDAGNPFDSETFIFEIQPWLNKVPAERLRNAAIEALLITDRITIATLKRTQANSGSADHNGVLVESIVAGGRDAYQKLCNVVKTLGYDGRHEQMVQLLRRPGPQLDAGEDEEAYGDPFQQRAFLTDIFTWLGKLPAGTFRMMAQEAGFFADLVQIEDLKRIEKLHGTRAHNQELVNIVSREEQAGYIKLVKVIERWGRYPDKVDKMNQLLPWQDRVNECAAAPPSLREIKAAEQEAARLEGTAVINFLHVAILGEARAGKTSLLKALLGQDHDGDEPSTLGMHTSYATTNISADRRFIECSNMPDALGRLHVSTKISKPSASNHPEDKETTQGDGERATAGEDPAADDRHPQPTAILPQPVEPAMSKEIHETIRRFLTTDRVKYISDEANTSTYTVITFRDLGGQQVYQSVQPLFMAPNTTFIATYNSSLDLEERLPDHDKLQVSREECIDRATLPANATRLDQLLSWLDMLLMNAKADSSSTEESAADDVFIVGCKSDEWEKKNLPDPCKLVHEKIKGSKYRNLVWYYTSHFKIDNTRSNGSAAQPDELQRLRDAIINRCHESQRKIAVPWLRFCIAIHMFKQQNTQPWISFEEAKFIAKEVQAVPNDCSDQLIQQLLTYCHNAGHLAYFPISKLKDKVILKPEFILDCVNAFAYPKPDRNITPIEKRRHLSGFMTESLARRILDKMTGQAVEASGGVLKDIFDILEWLSVLAIVKDNRSGNQAFIVPAAVQRKKKVPPAPLSCAYVCLKHAHAHHGEYMNFPVFVFWQCVVEALQKSWDGSAATLSQCSVRLRWNRDWKWLHLHYTRYGLQVYVKGNRGGCSGKSTLEEVKTIVRDVLEKWGHQAEVICSLPCPCRRKAEECLQHGLSTCASCPHLLDASTLKAGDYPLCRLPEPKTKMIREQARFWLGLDQGANKMLVEHPGSASPLSVKRGAQQRADGGAEAPTARLPTTKEPKKKLKLRVRRGVKRSEQKGMHRGRLHQQQQADGGAEAPTGRLPMTKEPKKKLKLRVRRGVKRSEQKGMHRGRLHQQQQADSEAEAPTATKKKFKRGVKRGARRSEQKGMHGGRLHQQQQADSRAEAPPAKKKMFYDDPFDHPDYVAKIDLPLKDLDGVELRRRLQTKGKLTKSQVRRLEKMSSETAHNNEMIGWIQDYHRDGYVALCEIIQEWGVVPELLEDMKNLL